MNCTICNKPIMLVPTAEERARKYGGKPKDFLAIFTEHAACTINKRNADTSALIRRLGK